VSAIADHGADLTNVDKIAIGLWATFPRMLTPCIRQQTRTLFISLKTSRTQSWYKLSQCFRWAQRPSQVAQREQDSRTCEVYIYCPECGWSSESEGEGELWKLLWEE